MFDLLHEMTKKRKKSAYFVEIKPKVRLCTFK